MIWFHSNRAATKWIYKDHVKRTRSPARTVIKLSVLGAFVPDVSLVLLLHFMPLLMFFPLSLTLCLSGILGGPVKEL